MFDSHLGGEVTEELGSNRQAHGRVVQSHSVPQHTGGSRGVLEGSDTPDQRMYTVVGLPAEAEHWEGSDTHYQSSELPTSTPDGHGFRGSRSICSASDLEKIDGRGRPQEAQTTPAQQPGAYLLTDGNVLVVGPNGHQQIITQQQYEAWRAQAQPAAASSPPPQQQRPSLMGTILDALKGRG